MTFVRFNPLLPVASSQRLTQLVDGMLHGGINQRIGSDSYQYTPAVNITQTDAAYQVHLAAPGLTKDRFRISLVKAKLAVEVATNATPNTQDEPTPQHETQEPATQWLRREFGYDNFKRSFELPEHIDQNAITAAYENGILVVNLPKKVNETALQREISIA